jgi:hypothetical protein
MMLRDGGTSALADEGGAIGVFRGLVLFILLAVTATPNSVPGGTQVTYSLTVRNGQGGGFFATANGVRVVHNLPSGIGFQSATGDRVAELRK